MQLPPTLPTSGWLNTGVETMPPSLPRLVTVMVEPDSSSRVALPARALAASRDRRAASPQIQRLHLAQHRHHQARISLRCSAQMDSIVQRPHAGFVVEAGIDLQERRHRPHDSAHDQGQGESSPRAAPYCWLSSSRSATISVKSTSST